MAQRIQQSPPSAPDSLPQVELAAVLAEDHANAKAPALSVPAPVDYSTGTYAKIALTPTIDKRAGKRETAVQVCRRQYPGYLQLISK